jgi:hypothetical protein
VKPTDYEAAHYAAFSILLPLPPSEMLSILTTEITYQHRIILTGEGFLY